VVKYWGKKRTCLIASSKDPLVSGFADYSCHSLRFQLYGSGLGKLGKFHSILSYLLHGAKVRPVDPAYLIELVNPGPWKMLLDIYQNNQASLFRTAFYGSNIELSG